MLKVARMQRRKTNEFIDEFNRKVKELGAGHVYMDWNGDYKVMTGQASNNCFPHSVKRNVRMKGLPGGENQLYGYDREGRRILNMRPVFAVDIRVKVNRHREWCQKMGKPFRAPTAVVTPTAIEMALYGASMATRQMRDDAREQFQVVDQAPPAYEGLPPVAPTAPAKGDM